MNTISTMQSNLHNGKNNNNGTTFQSLLITKPPWAQYNASNWSGTTLLDITGNGHNATTSGVYYGSGSGNGATATINYIGGAPSNTILFPVGSIPASFTICSLTRLTATPYMRVLTSTVLPQYLHGFFGGWRGVLFRNGVWCTSQSNTGIITDWLNMCATTGNTSIDNILVDGVPKGISNIASGTSQQLCINLGFNNDNSPFQLSQLIIWDRVLTSGELLVVSNALKNYLSTGLLK
jgi:hypothetical protein